MKLKLIYPDLPFWRAETSRLHSFSGMLNLKIFGLQEIS